MSAGTAPALGRRAARLVVVCALLLTAAVGPVGSAGAADARAAMALADDDSALSVAIEREGSTLRYRATVHAPANATTLHLDGAFGILTVTNHSGFVAEGPGYRLAAGRESATLTAEIDLAESRETALGRVGPDGPFQAGDGWAFAPSPRFSVLWTTTDGAAESVSLGADRVPVESAQAVTVGQRFVFLGAHEVRTRTVDGRPVRVVLPADTEFVVGTDRAFDLFGGVAEETGGTDEVSAAESAPPETRATVFVLPESVRSGGAASGRDLWVRADAGPLTVAHEYAHTVLSLPTTERTRWLAEAAAEYVAYRVAGPEELGPTLASRVRHPDADLTDPASWPDATVPYRKGAAVLYALDQRLVRVTDGEASMTTLLARLSRTQDRERIDDAALASAVSAVGDEETADWLARHDDGGLPDTVAKPVAAGVDGDAATGLFSMDGPLGAVSKLVALVASLGAVSVVLWLPARLCYRLSRSLLRASG